MEKLKINNNEQISLLFKIILFVCLFSSSFIFFKYPFEFYFHYIIFIFLIPLFLLKFGFPRLVFNVLILPFFVGLINVLLGNYQLFDFIKVLGGLTATILFFYHFINYSNFKINILFNLYIKFCYFISLIGFIQLISFRIGFFWGYDYSWLFNKWGVIKGGIIGIRINSILAEPSQLAIVISPAIYVAIRNLIRKESFILNKYQSILILIVLIFTTSTVGYFGFLLSLILVIEGFKLRYLAIGFLISLFLYQITYNNIYEFKSRVDSAFGLWIDNDFSILNTNNSSFVLYNNLHIAKENLIENPVFGTGIGSHEAAFNKHSLTGKVIQYDFAFNKKDGNSLFIRLCTETGLVGVVFIIIFILKGFVYKPNNETQIINLIISQSIFVLIILSFIRQGNYMLNGLPFLFLLYYYNFQTYKEPESNSLSIKND